MKLLLPFKVGDVIRTNYKTGPYRIVDILEGCTCADYLDVIDIGLKAHKECKREPHLHFTLVDADEPISKSGKYHERKLRWIGDMVYRSGECVDIRGPHARNTAGWHKEDNGLDKIILVKLAAPEFAKVKKSKTKPTTTECDDEDEN